MSDPYKTLERQLDAAVRSRARGGAPSGSRWAAWRRWPRGAVPAVVGLGLLGAGGATAAIVLSPDDRSENQVKQALFAGMQAGKEAPACRRVPARTPRLVGDPVPAWLTSKLGLLRRPATAADRVPLSRLSLGGREVLRDSVRVARADDGWSYRFWVSRGAGSVGVPGLADPVGCQQIRGDASIEAAAGFGPGVRDKVARIVDGELTRVRDRAAGRTLTFSLTELRPDGRPTGGWGGVLRAGRIPATGGVGPYRRGDRRSVSLSGLVPDGVTSVRVVDGSGSPRERAVRVRVADNVFHVLLPRRMGPRMTVEWRDAAGAVVRRTHPRY